LLLARLRFNFADNQFAKSGQYMKTWGKLGLTAFIVIAAGAALAGYRYATFAATGIGVGKGIVVAAAPPFDSAQAAANLSAAIRLRTISHQDPAQNDLTQWAALQSWLQQTYPAAHRAMRRELVATRTLVYTWQGSDPALKPVILMAHQDVVPVTPGTEKDWQQDPFSGAIAGGFVWGRGAVDDKGSLITLFEALDALARSGFKPKRTIYLVSGHDEEAGGTGAVAAAALLASRGVTAQFALDEGGIFALDAPILNGSAAMIGIAEKGYATLKVTAKAQGGHSSMPPPETGVVNLAKAVLAINAAPFAMELRGPAAKMLDALAVRSSGLTKLAVANQWLFGGMVTRKVASSPSGAAALHTTIAPTMLTGSPKENVLPQTATALINYRIAPWNTSDQIMQRAKEATKGQPVSLSWVKPPLEPSKTSSANSPGWNIIAASAIATSPGITPAPYLVVGGTDGRAMQNVSDDVYRLLPFSLALKDTAMLHGTNERVSIANINRAINFYARLIATSAG
jgi:carboxypeptidase PM20D1